MFCLFYEFSGCGLNVDLKSEIKITTDSLLVKLDSVQIRDINSTDSPGDNQVSSSSLEVQ